MTRKLIVFDMNGTLIENNSWLDLNLAMGITEEEDSHLLAKATAGEITDREGQQWLLNAYRERGDVSRGNIMKVLGKITYKPHAHTVITELKKRGHIVAIVSGAMNILVEYVAEELNVDHWRATNTFVFDNDDKLVHIEAAENESEGKLASMQNLMRELNFDYNDCIAVGDGSSDILLFRATGNGVTFSDSHVTHEAKYTINDLSDLLQIVDSV